MSQRDGFGKQLSGTTGSVWSLSGCREGGRRKTQEGAQFASFGDLAGGGSPDGRKEYRRRAGCLGGWGGQVRGSSSQMFGS